MLTRDILLQLLETLTATGASIDDPSALYSDKAPLSTPWGYYTINVKKSTWMIIGLMLDLTLTMGGASAVLAVLGATGKSIGKVHEENGERCVYAFLLEHKKPCTSEQIIRGLCGECRKYNWGCAFRNDDDCVIDRKALELTLQQLAEIGAIALTSDREWRLEL